MRYTIRYPRYLQSIYRNTISVSSQNVGTVISGVITNTSVKELFLSSGHTSSLRNDSQIGVKLSIDGGTQSQRAEIEINDSQFSFTNDGIPGSYILPQEQLRFKAVSFRVLIGSSEIY